MTLVWLDDLRLNADLTGPLTGPPLVLIHGLGLDGRLWDALIPRLTGQRILRLDLRGHGASDTPPPPYAMGAMIRDVERLMTHFALKDAVVLGAGAGGLIAQGLAVKCLDLVCALVLTGSATRFANPSVWKTRLARLRGEGPDLDAECGSPPRPQMARLADACCGPGHARHHPPRRLDRLRLGHRHGGFLPDHRRAAIADPDPCRR